MPIFEGVYRYHSDGDVQVNEFWAIEQRGVQHWQIRVDRTSNAGSTLSLRSEIRPDERLFAFTFYPSDDAAEPTIAAYRINRESIAFRRANEPDWSIAGPAQKLFFPLMRLWTGRKLLQLIQYDGAQEVLVPDIRNPTQAKSLFAPLASERHAWADPDQPSIIHYEGGEYDTPIAVHLSADGLMQHYVWTAGDGSVWTCELEHDANAPGWSETWSELRQHM